MKAPHGAYLAALGTLLPALAGLVLLALAGGGTPPLAVGLATLALTLLGGVLVWRVRGLIDGLAARAATAEAELARRRAVAALPEGWSLLAADDTLDGPPLPSPLAPAPVVGSLVGRGSRDTPASDLRRVLETLPADLAEALRTAVSRLRAAGDPFVLTLPRLGGVRSEGRRTEGRLTDGRRTDGRRTVEVTGRRVEGPDGRWLHLLRFADVTVTTERVAALEAERTALEAELQRLHRALDLLPVPLWIRRGDLAIAWCNRAFARLLDTQPEEVVARRLELPGGGLAEPPKDLAARAWGTRVAQSDRRYLVADGDRRLLELTEAPLPAEDLLLGHALDRTVEQGLRDELERHVAAHGEVLEQLGSGIAIYGADMRLKFHNHAYARLWDLDAGWLDTEPTYGEVLEELRARRKLTEQADFPRWKKQRIALFTSLIEMQEDMIHLPDGRTLRSLSVPHPFGGLMFVLEDVTHTLALESSYNTLMAVQQETLDNLAEGVVVFGGDGRLKLYNPAFLRLWQLTPDRLRGEPHAATLVEMVRPLLDTRGTWDRRKEAVVGSILDRTARTGREERADGSIIQFAHVPLPDGAVLLSYLDVTDSARVEQALRSSNEALEAADRLKAEFIANVSYQLRTPLNVIMGFAEILHHQYFGELNDRQLSYTRGVLDASRRLLDLINDILDLATIEAGFMVLDRAPVDVGQLLTGVAAITRDWARKQDLDLRVDLPPEGTVVAGDERRLKQALFNLVSNAVKFTPAGGRIVLSALPGETEVVLRVTDTGIGIPTADHQRVFGRFERSNAQARQTGAGLGLSLVKSFVELHGGTVEIESVPDLGTTISCRLPAAAPATAPDTDTEADAEAVPPADPAPRQVAATNDADPGERRIRRAEGA